MVLCSLELVLLLSKENERTNYAEKLATCRIREVKNIHPLPSQEHCFRSFRSEMQENAESGENWNVNSTYTKRNGAEARSTISA